MLSIIMKIVADCLYSSYHYAENSYSDIILSLIKLSMGMLSIVMLIVAERYYGGYNYAEYSYP